jgi:hypothetical protein
MESDGKGEVKGNSGIYEAFSPFIQKAEKMSILYMGSLEQNGLSS